MSTTAPLVDLLRTFCDTHGVDAETHDVWKAWKTFKAFSRATADVPDPGHSVQLISDETGRDRLLFMKQDVAGDERWLKPQGGVVWEFCLAQGSPERDEVIRWSLDCGTFEEFVDAVEGDDELNRALSKEAVWGRIYWADVGA